MRRTGFPRVSHKCAGAGVRPQGLLFFSRGDTQKKNKLGDTPGNVSRGLEERPSGLTCCGRGQRCSGDMWPTAELFSNVIFFSFLAIQNKDCAIC